MATAKLLTRDETSLADAAAADPPQLPHFVSCWHHERRFAGLVHAAEPAGEKLVAQLLFTDAIVLPDLHRLAAARTGIAAARDDDILLSRPLPAQIAPPKNTNLASLAQDQKSSRPGHQT
jgi:hypothetical protein